MEQQEFQKRLEEQMCIRDRKNVVRNRNFLL